MTKVSVLFLISAWDSIKGKERKIYQSSAESDDCTKIIAAGLYFSDLRFLQKLVTDYEIGTKQRKIPLNNFYYCDP